MRWMIRQRIHSLAQRRAIRRRRKLRMDLMNIAPFSSDHSNESLLQVRVLWALCHRWRAGMSLRSEPVGDCVLWIVTEGAAHIQLENSSWQIAAGQWFLAPPGQARVISVARPASWLSICLRARILEHTDVLHLANPPLKFDPPAREFEELQQLGALLARHWSGSGEMIVAQPHALETFHQRLDREPMDNVQNLLVRSLGEALFATLWREITRRDETPVALRNLAHDFPDWLLRVLEMVRNQPRVSVDEMARCAGFSASRFRLLFWQRMGIAPRDYLQRTRLEHARRLLETTDFPIAHIAAQTGFASAAHFTHLFRRAMGFTPRDYRKTHGRAGV
jgi:AraC-like DNA-binding protein